MDGQGKNGQGKNGQGKGNLEAWKLWFRNGLPKGGGRGGGAETMEAWKLVTKDQFVNFMMNNGKGKNGQALRQTECEAMWYETMRAGAGRWQRVFVEGVERVWVQTTPETVEGV